MVTTTMMLMIVCSPIAATAAAATIIIIIIICRGMAQLVIDQKTRQSIPHYILPGHVHRHRIQIIHHDGSYARNFLPVS